MQAYKPCIGETLTLKSTPLLTIKRNQETRLVITPIVGDSLPYSLFKVAFSSNPPAHPADNRAAAGIIGAPRAQKMILA